MAVSIGLLLRVAGPLPALLASLSLLRTRPTLPSTPSDILHIVVEQRVPRRGLVLALLSLLALSGLIDGLIFVAFAVIDKAWPHNTGIEYNAILVVVAYAGLAALGAWKEVQGVEVWSRRRLKWAIAASTAVDVALVAFLASRTRFPVLNHQTIAIIFPSFRVLAGVILVAALASPIIVYKPVTQDSAEDESAALLAPPASTGLSPLSALHAPSESSKYGTFRPPRTGLVESNSGSRMPSPRRSAGTVPDEGIQKPEISLDPSWSEIWQRFLRLTPYLWPSKSRPLQLLMLLCAVLILVGRFVNALLPFTLGEIVRIFDGTSTRSVWPVLLFYVLLRFLQGSGGLAALRDCLWTPVMQYSDRQMSQLAFDHLLQLSFNFHTHRNTGQVLRVLDRGAAINRTLEHLLFIIAPTFIDITVALVIFCWTFGVVLAAVVFVVIFLYVTASVVLTRWRTRLRRRMNECDVVTRGIASDTLLNYETVKYFSGEEQEARRYQEAISDYQNLESRVIWSLNLLNLVQNLIISTGLLFGSLIVAHRVTTGESAPADFIVFITYLAQLYVPLNQLGFMYRTINQTLIDTEKLLELLNEPTEVEDSDNAATLAVDGGEIEFENVSFSYDHRTTALNGVSFKVPKGSSVALVGESGSGKSTILRLLYRFYDLPLGGGRILIDGQDIRDVTQKSLRAAIGVVPQDSSLFNTTIEYNIGYGKFGATPEEIEAAARSAQMHERISAFPDGYKTRVGERGVRLSGGEKQRVAIARTLLKNPPILLLDEATSALDTTTEKDIQKALQNLMQGRSSLSIAHRLSTIASADIILVLKDGQIVERGSHSELLAQDGIFAAMWADQVSTSGDVPTPAPTDKPLPETEESGPVADIVPEAEPDLDVIGYSTEPEEAKQLDGPENPVTEMSVEEPAANLDEPVATEPETTFAPKEDHAAVMATPIAFPSSDPEPASESSATPKSPLGSQPVTFPVSEEAAATEERPSTPGVTFEPGLASSTTSPDPESEPKRKRISSQNFARIARRISMGNRRQGSASSIASIIPGLKRSDKGGADDGSGSGRNSVESAPGVSDKGKKGKKKTGPP
ncbi:ABC transporter protein [Mycena kentingensis (nom. inval.)]|nr:ABC transporter protein [Mycena kentingensis (nom. inval.)]